MTSQIDRVSARRARVRAFVRDHFGFRGTIALHRAAVGFDLLRAPANVVLAPLFLLARLVAFVAGRLGLVRTARWLSDRRVFFDTAVARQVALRVTALVDQLEQAGLVRSDPMTRKTAINDYVATRSAVAEIVTTLFVLIAGIVLFQAVTPGMISLAGPLAELRAKTEAVAGFPLGSGLGRLYYGVFPVALPVWQVMATGVFLAIAGALVTTFGGILADPVQVMTGTHRRRLMRLLDRIDQNATGGLEREHMLARAGDVADAVLSLWRALRG
jgi:hypothetical protein